MSKKTIDIQEISNQFEKDILKLLEEKEEYVYGDIIKDLKLSARKGQVLISSLISKGLVKRVDQTSYLKLNVEIN
ncbi:hypothetical protein SAMN05444285_12457 [Draconibacterium orientale]|jgi:DNA-binding MarR family transcriptional regulator|uniref:Uncharacterized protein n=1 Tax=Draconibacterium orientale TaxID=1168034 RepID=X5DN55_9BACT|nr:hypothetical protein [Draconibacterium orientale]AHW62047.1 hypothetical protein FH5T_13965 [Draconibacterium orientale]SET81839.1 hypothetical protein SAMN05444285_12457 [Draconibacterium orientale]